MFTGIITDMGEVTALQRNAGGDCRFTIRTNFPMEEIAMGASIACDGCCLTVVAKSGDKSLSSSSRKRAGENHEAFAGGGAFEVDVSNESLSRTNLKNWAIGRRVNLERSLKLGDELGGHIVSGHVDGLATLLSVTPDGESFRLKVRAPQDLAHYVASKGSVALNGVSLTVNEVEGDVFGLNIIPHTWAHTNLGSLKAGDVLNMEADMLARYVARMLERKAA